MGLLGKAAAINAHTESGGALNAVSGNIQSFIINYHRKNLRFHVIVLQESEVSRKKNINGMIACHGGAVTALSGGNLIVLLPGALDRELFTHRLSQSAGLTTLSQLSADSPSLALETLSSYLQ